ncbi:hypothetical protein BC832DRAFT_538547 [Gaertneriomyces semiglobifer]|nr:hypothetical protein BC832DRAFT_538547 [Gaertneriomyces semiglobifer]
MEHQRLPLCPRECPGSEDAVYEDKYNLETGNKRRLGRDHVGDEGHTKRPEMPKSFRTEIENTGAEDGIVDREVQSPPVHVGYNSTLSTCSDVASWGGVADPCQLPKHHVKSQQPLSRLWKTGKPVHSCGKYKDWESGSPGYVPAAQDKTITVNGLKGTLRWPTEEIRPATLSKPNGGARPATPQDGERKFIVENLSRTFVCLDMVVGGDVSIVQHQELGIQQELVPPGDLVLSGIEWLVVAFSRRAVANIRKQVILCWMLKKYLEKEATTEAAIAWLDEAPQGEPTVRDWLQAQ